MKRHWVIGIMASLGLIVGKMLLPILGDYMTDHSVNPVTNTQVQKYIDQSRMMTFQPESFTYSKITHKDNFLSNASMFKDYWQRCSYTFFDKAMKKYFAVEVFNFPDVVSINDLFSVAKHKTIECAINMDELADTTFGSEANPVASYKCVIPSDTSWNEAQNNRARMIRNSNAHYVTAVLYQLKYYMPKQEYKKLFPGQK